MQCINLLVPVLAPSSSPLFLYPAMHLFGLNWQLQESEVYGAFENGGGGRDTTPNTFMVSTDNGKSHFIAFLLFLSLGKATNNIRKVANKSVGSILSFSERPELFMNQC